MRDREVVIKDTVRRSGVVIEEQQGHAGLSKEEVVCRQDGSLGVCDRLPELDGSVVDGLEMIRRDGDQTALLSEKQG